ncbi:hypothetical protein CQA63_01550 [Helicobacter marmotae]|uniref:Uncharacterized protein n=1 Tax=Helicobacter marmotae TaxID=152490 RepID=A0A3D8I6C6_9HELI|nr:hypothetical protein CQA63_01550 [Helicobacter marmotae]
MPPPPRLSGVKVLFFICSPLYLLVYLLGLCLAMIFSIAFWFLAYCRLFAYTRWRRISNGIQKVRLVI